MEEDLTHRVEIKKNLHDLYDTHEFEKGNLRFLEVSHEMPSEQYHDTLEVLTDDVVKSIEEAKKKSFEEGVKASIAKQQELLSGQATALAVSPPTTAFEEKIYTFEKRMLSFNAKAFEQLHWDLLELRKVMEKSHSQESNAELEKIEERMEEIEKEIENTSIESVSKKVKLASEKITEMDRSLEIARILEQTMDEKKYEITELQRTVEQTRDDLRSEISSLKQSLEKLSSFGERLEEHRAKIDDYGFRFEEQRMKQEEFSARMETQESRLDKILEKLDSMSQPEMAESRLSEFEYKINEQANRFEEFSSRMDDQASKLEEISVKLTSIGTPAGTVNEEYLLEEVQKTAEKVMEKTRKLEKKEAKRINSKIGKISSSLKKLTRVPYALNSIKNKIEELEKTTVKKKGNKRVVNALKKEINEKKVKGKKPARASVRSTPAKGRKMQTVTVETKVKGKKARMTKVQTEIPQSGSVSTQIN